tara:strand:- start:114 stop:512 length:399 start_codon:yes stop_codon:yes gene_type:complete
MDLEILKIASNTDNHKVLKKCTHNSKLKNSICGDEMEISLNVVKDNIVDFGYQCKSCVYCQASVSLLSKNTLNKKLLNVENLLKIAEIFFEKENATFPKEWSIFNKIFNKKNSSRKECLLLPFKTLSKALNL